MSTCPGLTLEEFLMWNFDLIVDGDASANVSLAIAEALGKIQRRREMTREQFAPIVAFYEPFRERVETLLDQFGEDSMSWREYASVFAFLPDRPEELFPRTAQEEPRDGR